MTTDAASVLPSRDMTTDEFKAWYVRLGLTETELAHRLDVTQPTINRWSTGQRKPPGYLWRALEHLADELEDERPATTSTAPEDE